MHVVATRPDARRPGYARAVARALLDELRTEHVTLFERHASQEAAPLYREFGFAGSSALMRMAYLEEPGPGELEGIGCGYGAGPGWVPPEQYAENKPS
ncbi:GNAT family N-acetyltransferase [Streptomyces decoyicus]